jgi:Flp pilus assembly pilin Flp
MKALLKRFVKDEAGLETIEYAILAAIVVAVAVVGYSTLADVISAKFVEISENPNLAAAGE